MAVISARAQAPCVGRQAARSVCRPAPAARVTRFTVRAQAEAAAKEEAPKWTEPTLNPDTPSPIFGGSTGGLLRKAQVIT